MKVRGIPLPLSKSCRDVNPQLEKKGVVIVPEQTVKNVFTIKVPHSRSRTRVGLRCGMNKTEREYALILEARKRAGEIRRYEFEGITLRFANVKYTPDFVVFKRAKYVICGKCGYYELNGSDDCRECGKALRVDPMARDVAPIKFIEVKGPFIKGNRERAVERFRHAKTYWPEFTFEMMQKKDGQWRQII